jgi:hypothetical protein
MSGDLTEIAAVLETYFVGFYEGNVDKLKSVFNPACHLYSAAVTPMMDSDMEAVYDRVNNRVRPSVRGDARDDGILTIDQSAPECAFAKVYICLGDQHFTDYLTLLKIDGTWSIITKTFTAQPREGVLPL